MAPEDLEQMCTLLLEELTPVHEEIVAVELRLNEKLDAAELRFNGKLGRAVESMIGSIYDLRNEIVRHN